MRSEFQSMGSEQTPMKGLKKWYDQICVLEGLLWL
jgi:hypothetical protein